MLQNKKVYENGDKVTRKNIKWMIYTNDNINTNARIHNILKIKFYSPCGMGGELTI